jgi:hypothetical protein
MITKSEMLAMILAGCPSTGRKEWQINTYEQQNEREKNTEELRGIENCIRKWKKLYIFI